MPALFSRYFIERQATWLGCVCKNNGDIFNLTPVIVVCHSSVGFVVECEAYRRYGGALGFVARIRPADYAQCWYLKAPITALRIVGVFYANFRDIVHVYHHPTVCVALQ